MQQRFLFPFSAIILALAATLHAQPAPAAPPAAGTTATPAHVGVVKFRLAYENLKYTLEAEQSLKAAQDQLTAMTADHQKQLEDLQKQINDAVKNHTDRTHLVDLLDDKALQFQVEEMTIKLRATRARNRQLEQAFHQIKAASEDIATKRGIDLVLVDESGSIPPDAADIRNLETLGKLLFNRDTLYTADSLDLTAAVIGQINSRFVPTSQPTPPPPLATTKMQIGSKAYTLEIAGDDTSHQRGMMERDTLEPDHGMIFVFATIGEQNFWARHTRFPLDVIFVDAGGKIVSVKSMKPYDETNTPSDGDSKYAIEILGGQAAASGVKAGDQLKIPPAVDAALPKPVKK